MAKINATVGDWTGELTITSTGGLREKFDEAMESLQIAQDAIYEARDDDEMDNVEAEAKVAVLSNIREQLLASYSSDLPALAWEQA